MNKIYKTWSFGLLLLSLAALILSASYLKEISIINHNLTNTRSKLLKNLKQKIINDKNVPKGYATDCRKVSSGYGERIHPVTHKKMMHTGIDFPCTKGSSVSSTAPGVVLNVSFDKIYGNNIIIKHSNKYKTRYGHLMDTYVKKGDVVRKGDVIGVVGNTGRSTGPHLHYEVIEHNQTVNPTTFLN